jgi:predicted Rossmann fold nucleotide-binding protein DprA/Smf involved in DNA uptake
MDALEMQLALEADGPTFMMPGTSIDAIFPRQHCALAGRIPDDILGELKFTSGKQSLTGPARRRNAAPWLDKDYKILLDALGFEPASLNTLVERTGLPSQSVASMLLLLELEDVVGLHSGGRYLRL